MILVDTRVVVWLAFDQDQISRKARTALDDARENADGLAISDISVLELAALASSGRIRLEHQPRILPARSRVSVRGSAD